MPTPNSKLSERLAVLAATLPATSTAGGTITSSFVNIAGTTGSGQMFSRLLILANAGNSATNAITVSVLKSTSSTGGGSTAIATQTATGTSTPIVEFDVNAFTQGLNDTNATYIGFSIVSTLGTLTGGGIILGGDGRYDPASTFNASNVTLSTSAVV